MRPLAIALMLVALAGGGCAENSPVDRTLGARCDDSSECDDRCLMPADGWPGGLCSLSCDDDGDCPGDAACVEDEGGVCLYDCTGDPECDFLGDGWSCQVRDERPSGDPVMVCRGS